MSRYIALRFALRTLAVAGFLANAAIALPQDSQSVAEAARQARAQKKNSEKRAKVITDETLDVKKGDVQSAAAEQLRMPGSSETQAPPADNSANTASSAAQGSDRAKQDEKAAKERAALRERIKETLSDLDLLQREQALQRDTYYSNPDYTHDTGGKAKLDGLKEHIADKQQELDRLKARLAELGPATDNSSATPPKP